MLIIRPLLLLLTLTQFTSGKAQCLSIIAFNNKIGFINKEGAVVIPPVYHNGFEFSEGLAPVREDGLFGFIDSTGKYTIAPEYDFATPFEKGIALVYRKNNPYFIDKTNKVVFPPVYKGLQYINDQKGIITTRSNKQGVIDVRTGHLLIDTMFSDISEFTNGVAVVKEYVRKSRKSINDRVAVIDSTGKFIVHFGKYDAIRPFHEGYAIVELSKKNLDQGVIDTDGRLIFKIKERNGYIDEDFHEGLARVSLHTPSSTEYEGYINLHGNVVINDTTYTDVRDFSCGRAFVKTDSANYFIIDKDGKRVSPLNYAIENEKFINDHAIVNSNIFFWGIIDTNAHFIIKPQYGSINFPTPFDDYFFFTYYTEGNRDLFGMADLHNNVIIKPIMQTYAAEGFVNGLLKSIVDNRLTYFNRKGEIIWQAPKEDSLPLQYLNIDYMNRSYFYAYSSTKDADRGGGWGISGNKPKMINNSKQFADQALSLTIDTSVVDTFAQKYYGFKVYLSNRTTDTIRFNAEDSRLSMKLQAFDELGSWKDIEYNPHSWCGNSYHTIELEPEAYWSFTIPRYTGAFRTSIRVELKYIDKHDPKKELTLYSNPVKASINPGQFWNKKPYYPNGIMDPYFE